MARWTGRRTKLGVLITLLGQACLTVAAAGAGAGMTAEEGTRSDSLQAECEYGIALAFGGELERAEEVFTSLLSRSPGDARAFNNLGNLYVLRGEPEVALAFYNRAATADGKDAGICLNRATIHMMKGESEAAETEAAKAIDLAGGMAEAAALLGIQAGPPAGAAGDSGAAAGAGGSKAADKTRMNKQEVLTLLNDALQEVPSDSTVKADSTATATGAKKKKGTWRSGGARAADQGDSEPILYWKR